MSTREKKGNNTVWKLKVNIYIIYIIKTEVFFIQFENIDISINENYLKT